MNNVLRKIATGTMVLFAFGSVSVGCDVDEKTERTSADSFRQWSPFCDAYEGHRVRIEIPEPGFGALISLDDPFPDNLFNGVFMDSPSAYSTAESSWVVDCSEDDDIMFQHMSPDSQRWLWAAGPGLRVSTKHIEGNDVPVTGNTEWMAMPVQAPEGDDQHGVWALRSVTSAGTLYAQRSCGPARVITGPDPTELGSVTAFHVRIID